MMTALLETSGAHGRTRRLRWLAAVVITALVVLGSAFEFWRRTDAPGEIQLTLKPFTHDHGVTQDSTISEDGRMVAYTSDRDTKGSLELYIESTDSSHRRQLTFDGADKSEPSISPDGRWIAFRSESKGGGIYMMPMGGGERRSVAAGGRTARFSPNGTRIAFWTGDEGVFPHVPGRIFIVDTSGGASRQLVSDFVGARYPVWTSDGRHILFEGLRESGRSWDKSAEWWVLELDSGRVFPTGAQAALRSRGLTAFTMPSNFRGNSFVASARGEQATNLYKVDLLPDTWELANAPRQLTNGTGVLMSPWVSRSGQVVASNLEIAFNILRIPERRTLNEPLLRVTDNAYLNASPTVSRNGGWMTFSRSLGRMRDIWMMQLNTRQETLLAAGDAKYSIVLRPDGEEVAYSMNENGRHAIHLLSVKTRNDVRLCTACGDPTGWSPSLENLLVSNGSPGQIELLSTRGGDPTILLHRPGYELGEAQFSPDGGWIAFRAGLGGDRVRLYVAPYRATGAIPPQDWIPITEGEFWEDKPHWSTDGNTLYFESTRDNFTCLWSQKLEAVSRRPTGHPSTLVDFHTREFGPGAVSSESFNISVGGNYIFFNAADVRANVWSGSLSSTE
jgi:Tol biopolymer transport system component